MSHPAGQEIRDLAIRRDAILDVDKPHVLFVKTVLSRAIAGIDNDLFYRTTE